MKKHLHILGVCGTFMGGIAMIARQLGYKVTGSDANVYPPMSDALKKVGIEIYDGFLPSHLQQPTPDLVLVGNVCSRGHAVVEYLLEQQIPHASGPEWLARHVLAERHVLAVSGTHGKTTVSSMLTWILSCAGLEPGYLIGGVAKNFMHTANLGHAPYFVIEADEYDSAFFDKWPKFLHYLPKTLIINNIEFDHGDIYADLDAIKKQFGLLIKTVPLEGKIIYHDDDSNIAEVLANGARAKTEAYCGVKSPWQYHTDYEGDPAFTVYYEGRCYGKVDWSLLGAHNKENAIAAIAAAHHIGIAPQIAVSALTNFQGVRRRMELLGEFNGARIYDDFAHHPTAIAKSLAALRASVGEKPVIAVLQFASNTMKSGQHGYQQIASALSIADRVILFNSGEYQFDINQVVAAIGKPTSIFDKVGDVVNHLKTTLKRYDNVLMMSNKNFGGLQRQLLASV